MIANGNTTAAVIRRSSGTLDEFGVPARTETAGYVGPAIYTPGNSAETTDAGDTVVTQPYVYLPTGTAVSVTDAVIPQVTLDDAGQPVLDDEGLPTGRRFDVDGEPTPWPPNPYSGLVHDFSVDVKLKGQTG